MRHRDDLPIRYCTGSGVLVLLILIVDVAAIEAVCLAWKWTARWVMKWWWEFSGVG